VESEAGNVSKSATRTGILDWPYERAVMLAGFVAYLLAVASFSGGNPASLAFIVPFLIPVIILCPLAIAKGKPWMYLGGAISLLLLPVLAAAFGIDSFVQPQLGPVFIASQLLLLSVLFGVPTGIAVFRRRRDPPAPMSLRAGLRTRPGLVALLLTGILLGAAITGEAAYLYATSGTVSSGADLTPEAYANVTTENFQFVPNNVSIPAGKLVEVTVVNKDTMLHTFTYTNGATTYSHNLLPSSTTKFQMLISAPGTVHFWCIPHQSGGMVGDFHVT